MLDCEKAGFSRFAIAIIVFVWATAIVDCPQTGAQMRSKSFLLVTLAEIEIKIEPRRFNYWTLIGVPAARFDNNR